MAQLVEQRIRNAQVVGSSPTISSRNPPDAGSGDFFFALYNIVPKQIPDAQMNIGDDFIIKLIRFRC